MKLHMHTNMHLQKAVYDTGHCVDNVEGETTMPLSCKCLDFPATCFNTYQAQWKSLGWSLIH